MLEEKIFVLELADKDYPSFSEDRLTQIFSASFNNSKEFRKVFLNLIGVGIRQDLRSETQKQYGDSKLDVLIFKENKPYIVIENKVDSTVYASQLRKYNSIKAVKNAKKVLIVKHLPDRKIPKQWKVIHWVDLYMELSKLLENRDLPEIDKFICANFASYLKEMGMYIPPKISKKDFYEMCEFLQKIREEKRGFSIDSNIAGTLQTFIMYLEEIVREAAKDRQIVKRIGKRFRPVTKINYGYYDDREKPPDYLLIEISIALKRPYRKIHNISLSLWIDLKSMKRSYISVDKYDGKNDAIDGIEYHITKRGIVFDELSKFAIKNFKKYLGIRK